MIRVMIAAETESEMYKIMTTIITISSLIMMMTLTMIATIVIMIIH